MFSDNFQYILNKNWHWNWEVGGVSPEGNEDLATALKRWKLLTQKYHMVLCIIIFNGSSCLVLKILPGEIAKSLLLWRNGKNYSIYSFGFFLVTHSHPILQLLLLSITIVSDIISRISRYMQSMTFFFQDNGIANLK